MTEETVTIPLKAYRIIAEFVRSEEAFSPETIERIQRLTYHYLPIPDEERCFEDWIHLGGDDDDEELEATDDIPGWPGLSEVQKQFVRDARRCKLTIRRYSGRFMYSRECPAVNVSHFAEIQTEVRYTWDNFGRDYVLYVP